MFKELIVLLAAVSLAQGQQITCKTFNNVYYYQLGSSGTECTALRTTLYALLPSACRQVYFVCYSQYMQWSGFPSNQKACQYFTGNATNAGVPGLSSANCVISTGGSEYYFGNFPAKNSGKACTDSAATLNAWILANNVTTTVTTTSTKTSTSTSTTTPTTTSTTSTTTTPTTTTKTTTKTTTTTPTTTTTTPTSTSTTTTTPTTTTPTTTQGITSPVIVTGLTCQNIFTVSKDFADLFDKNQLGYGGTSGGYPYFVDSQRTVFMYYKSCPAPVGPAWMVSGVLGSCVSAPYAAALAGSKNPPKTGWLNINGAPSDFTYYCNEVCPTVQLTGAWANSYPIASTLEGLYTVNGYDSLGSPTYQQLTNASNYFVKLDGIGGWGLVTGGLGPSRTLVMRSPGRVNLYDNSQSWQRLVGGLFATDSGLVTECTAQCSQVTISGAARAGANANWMWTSFFGGRTSYARDGAPTDTIRYVPTNGTGLGKQSWVISRPSDPNYNYYLKVPIDQVAVELSNQAVIGAGWYYNASNSSKVFDGGVTLCCATCRADGTCNCCGANCCPLGFRPAQAGGICADVDECALGAQNCGNGTVCSNTRGSFTCNVGCPLGYALSAATGLCYDVNECATGAHNCPSNGTLCRNTVGSFTCPAGCNAGFTLQNNVCLNVDECALGTHNCPANGTLCADSFGSFACNPGCNVGYTLSDVSGFCLDDNECALGTHSCPSNGTLCRNTAGSFTCPAGCNVGFALRNNACFDVDECALKSHSCIANGVCQNVVGSFACPATCAPGYALSADGNVCADVDECATGVHNCPTNGTLCRNTVGSFTCPAGCNVGFVLRGSVCSDNDECALKTHTCDATRLCQNTFGSFTCALACIPGFFFNGQSCDDIDECAAAVSPCPAYALCQNTYGSFDCSSCLDGFIFNALTQRCEDVDECTTSPCPAQAVCANAPGSFSCVCNAGFVGQGVDCQPCGAGSYREAGSEQVCVPCPLGTASGAVAQVSAAACTACTAGLSFAAVKGSASCTAVRLCPAGTAVAGFATASSDRPCKNCTLDVSFSTANNAAACTNVTYCNVTGNLKYVSTPATLTSDLVCTNVGECAAGKEYEFAPATATSARVCAACRTCVPGTYRTKCKDGILNAVCLECPPDQFSSKNNSIACLPYTPDCTAGYVETQAPAPTIDRVCTPLPFQAELLDNTVFVMAKRALALDLTTTMRATQGVEPFVYSIVSPPAGSYMVGDTFNIIFNTQGLVTLKARVMDKLGRSIDKSLNFVVSAALVITYDGGFPLAPSECYRDRPCEVPTVVVSGGTPPYDLTLVTVPPPGLTFADGSFSGTVTGSNQQVNLTFVVTDDLGFVTTATTYMNIRPYPITTTTTTTPTTTTPTTVRTVPVAAASSGNASASIAIGAAVGAVVLIAIIIIVVVVVLRRRRDDPHGIMVIKNPMYMPPSRTKPDDYATVETDDDLNTDDTLPAKGYLQIGFNAPQEESTESAYALAGGNMGETNDDDDDFEDDQMTYDMASNQQATYDLSTAQVDE